MPPEEMDAGRLWDMVTYAQEIVSTASQLSFHEYLQNKNLRLATERRIEIIGEAARNVSAEFQQAHPEIPWRKVIAQRHVLAHEYGDIRQEIVFRVATVHIPELLRTLRGLLPPQPPDTGSL